MHRRPVRRSCRGEKRQTLTLDRVRERSPAVASGAGCQLSLPCVGAFVLTACTTAGGPPACANLTVGKNATEWQQLPYSAFDEPVLLADKTQYAIGETATLWFQNPWSPEATALVLWGNQVTHARRVRSRRRSPSRAADLAVACWSIRDSVAFSRAQDSPKLKSKYLGKVPIGAFKVELPLGSESRGGAGVAVLLSVPRGEGVLDLQQGALLPPPSRRLFPPLRRSLAISPEQSGATDAHVCRAVCPHLAGFSVSLLFNPLGPHTHALVTSLNIAAVRLRCQSAKRPPPAARTRPASTASQAPPA